MFYQFNQQSLIELPYYEVNPDTLTVALISLNELAEIYEEMGFDAETYEQCCMKTSTFQNAPLIYGTYSFGLHHIINIEDTFQTNGKFAVYLMKHLLLIVDLYSDNQCTKKAFYLMLERMKSFPEITTAQLFCSFMTSFLSKDSQSLELLEIQLEALEKKVMSSNMDHVRQDLFLYRRKLLIIKNYYEQYITISQDFAENINQLFDESQLIYLRQMDSKVKRLCDHTRDLSEYVSQIKESYMAQLDINLNSTMKVFTIVTTIFMPLTLIVGWYGMNFRYMPELTWKYGYLWVIVLSITVVIISIYMFKKKDFF